MAFASRVHGKIRPQQSSKPDASPRKQGLDRLGRATDSVGDLGHCEPGDVLVQKHAPLVRFEVEKRRADNIGSFDLFEQFRWRQDVGRPVKMVVRSVAQGMAAAPTRAVVGYAKKPAPELSPAGVKPVEPFDGEQPHLLADVLGSGAVPAKQVIDQAKDVANMAIVHRGPRRPVTPRHRPDQVRFVVHWPATPVVSFPLPEYCRESSKSFATTEKKKGKSPKPWAMLLKQEPRHDISRLQVDGKHAIGEVLSSKDSLPDLKLDRVQFSG
jgi:hypothetical protein